MQELANYRHLAAHMPAGADCAEVQAEKQTVISITVTDGRFDEMSAANVTDLFARVISQGKSGLSHSQNLACEPEILLGQAFENSHFSDQCLSEPMNRPHDLTSRFEEREQEHSSIDELKLTALRLEEALRNAAGQSSLSQIRLTESIRTIWLVNSQGCDLTASRRIVEAEATLVQQHQRHMIFNEILSSTELANLNEDDFLVLLSHCRTRQLPAVFSGSGKFRAIIDASVVCNMLNTAWQFFAAPLYLSGSTPLAGRLGQAVFADNINIRDLPAMSGSGYTFAFDCEGSASTDVQLVRDGRLQSLIHTLASARAMAVKPTGNAGRKTLLSGTLHTQVSAMPKNFCLMPGRDSLAGLIEKLRDGIYIHESYDVFHSINIASGAFNVPCKGILIRNGEMAGVAEGLAIQGQLIDLLASVECVADDVRVLPMVMLKSYTVSAPSILVPQLQVVSPKGGWDQ